MILSIFHLERQNGIILVLSPFEGVKRLGFNLREAMKETMPYNSPLPAEYPPHYFRLEEILDLIDEIGKYRAGSDYPLTKDLLRHIIDVDDQLVYIILVLEYISENKEIRELEEDYSVESAIIDRVYDHVCQESHNITLSKEFIFKILNLVEEEIVKDFILQDLDKTPGDYIEFVRRGNAYCFLENYNEALKDYNMAISLNSQDYLAYSKRASLFQKLGVFNESLKDLQNAINNADGMNVYYVISLKLRKARLLLDLGRAGEFEQFIKSLFCTILKEARNSSTLDLKSQYIEIIQQMIEIVEQVEGKHLEFKDLARLKKMILETRTIFGI